MARFRNVATVHSHPQSLDSASIPEDMAKREVELGTGCMTATDHGSLAASYAVYEIARKKGLVPILGIEGYLRDDNCHILKEHGIDTPKEYNKYYHFTAHFLDQSAFQAAARILSRVPVEKHGSEEKPLFSWADLEELGSYSVGLSSGCLIGVTQRHLLSDRADLAEAYYQKYRAMAKPGNFGVEVFPHRCTHNWVAGVFVKFREGGVEREQKFWRSKSFKDQYGNEVKASDLPHSKSVTHLTFVKNYRVWEPVDWEFVSAREIEDFLPNPCIPTAPDGDVQAMGNRFVLEMAKKYGDPVYLADDSHFATPEQRVVQDVRLAQSGNWRFANSYHRFSSDEYFDYFNKYMGIGEKEFEGWLDNTEGYASRFKDFKLVYQPSLPKRFYPEDSLGYLNQLIQKHGRMKDDPVYRERLNYEIQALQNNGVIDLLPYYFFPEEVVEECNRAGEVPGAGRGSAPGSLIFYLLGVTHCDPIKWGLPFDRFFSEARARAKKMPDQDQDLSSKDFLIGYETEFVKVEMEDGSIRTFRATEEVETSLGSMTVKEAFSKKADILEDQSDS